KLGREVDPPAVHPLDRRCAATWPWILDTRVVRAAASALAAAPPAHAGGRPGHVRVRHGPARPPPDPHRRHPRPRPPPPPGATPGQAAAGLVTGVVSALTIAMELLSPNILHRFRVRDVLVASALVQLVAMAGFAAVRTLPAMLAWGALTGAGFGVFVTVVVVA